MPSGDTRTFSDRPKGLAATLFQTDHVESMAKGAGKALI